MSCSGDSTFYERVMQQLRAAGLDARPGMEVGGLAWLAVRLDGYEVHITDIDSRLPDDPADLNGWWAAFYRLHADGDLGDSVVIEKDFARDDIAGMAAWIAQTRPGGSG